MVFGLGISKEYKGKSTNVEIPGLYICIYNNMNNNIIIYNDINMQMLTWTEYMFTNEHFLNQTVSTSALIILLFEWVIKTQRKT